MAGGSNFDSYLVLLPTHDGDGVDHGWLEPIRVLALDEKDAIEKAVEKWWSGTHMYDGTAIVVKEPDATAYVLRERRGVEIVSEASLPGKGDA